MGLQHPTGDILAAEASSNLRKILVMKADKVDIEKLYELKSNKMETDGLLGVQEAMSK